MVTKDVYPLRNLGDASEQWGREVEKRQDDLTEKVERLEQKTRAVMRQSNAAVPGQRILVKSIDPSHLSESLWVDLIESANRSTYAVETVDGKNTVFRDPNPPPVPDKGYTEGDVWFQPNEGGEVTIWTWYDTPEGGEWRKEVVDEESISETIKDAIADAEAQANFAVQAANGKNTNYTGATAPSAPTGGFKVGDIWFDTSGTGTVIKTWTGSAWGPHEFDEVALPPSVVQDLADAVQDATDALQAANLAVTDTIIEYATNNSTSTAPSSGWSTSQPAWSANTKIWMRTKITYGSGSSAMSSPVLLTGPAGAKGDDGAGIEIAGTVATYAGLPGNLSPSDAGKAYLVSADGKLYIWGGTQFPANGSGVEFRGPQGDPGNTGGTGISVDSVIPYYRNAATKPAQPSGSAPAGWSTTEPAYVAGQKQWRSERVAYSNSTYSWTPVTEVQSYTVAANLQSAIDNGLMRAAKASNPPAVAKGLTWLVLDEDTGEHAVGLRIANNLGNAWVPYLFIVEDLMVVGAGGTIRLKNGVVTANSIEAGAVTVGKIAAGSITAGDGVIGSLDAGVISTGTLDADRIGAKTITVDKLVVASSGDNLLQDDTFQLWYRNNGTTPVEFAPIVGPGGSPAVVAAASSNTVYAGYYAGSATFARDSELRIPVVGNNDSFVASVWVYAPAAVASGLIGIHQARYTEAGTRTVVNVYTSSAIPANEWTRISVEWTLGATTRYLGLYLGVASGHTGEVYFSKPSLVRKVNGTLIEDGAITTDKIAANAISADKIAANTITAAKIATNAITTAELSAGAITSKHTITGAVLQTTSTANRGIKISSAGLVAYDSSGNQTISINATTGAGVFSGDFVAGNADRFVGLSDNIAQYQSVDFPGITFEIDSPNVHEIKYPSVIFATNLPGGHDFQGLHLRGPVMKNNDESLAEIVLERHGGIWMTADGGNTYGYSSSIDISGRTGDIHIDADRFLNMGGRINGNAIIYGQSGSNSLSGDTRAYITVTYGTPAPSGSRRAYLTPRSAGKILLGVNSEGASSVQATVWNVHPSGTATYSIGYLSVRT